MPVKEAPQCYVDHLKGIYSRVPEGLSPKSAFNYNNGPYLNDYLFELRQRFSYPIVPDKADKSGKPKAEPVTPQPRFMNRWMPKTKRWLDRWTKKTADRMPKRGFPHSFSPPPLLFIY